MDHLLLYSNRRNFFKNTIKLTEGTIMKMKKIFILLMLCCCILFSLIAQTNDSNERMKWWREARFGMFIHWGVYAVPAGIYKGQKINRIGEWIMNRGKIPVAEYQEFAKEFNPVKYDPEAWVKMAKDAGMKYIVITSKHHDGFALFDSKAKKMGYSRCNALWKRSVETVG